MSRASVPRLAVGLLLGSVATSALGLSAQEPAALRLRSISGELAGSFDGSWVNSAFFDPRSISLWQEWLELRVDGSLIHPRVASFRVVARPLLAQGTYLPRVDSLSTSGGGNALTGDARLELFRASLISGLVEARRSHDFRRTGFGGVLVQGVEQWGVELRDNDPRMPARISYASRNEQRDQTTGVPARQVFRDEWTRTFSYLAQSSKTRLFLERRDFRRGTELAHRGGITPGGDPSRDDFRFVQLQGQATHELRWGKGSRLLSRLQYMDRTHDLEFSSLSWSEAANLRQTRRVTSNISGTWARQSSPTSSGYSATGSYQLVFQASPTKRLELVADARETSSGEVSRRSSGIGPRVRAQIALPAGARLGANLHGSYRWNDQRTGKGLYAQSVQEPHRPGAAGLFTLDNPFADPASVVITSQSGDELYEEGLDYRVVLNGPFVEIHVLPGGRIGGDDVLLVDYRYEVVPRTSGRGMILGYDLSLAIGPLVLEARRNRQRDLGELAELPPGTARFLGDEDRSDLRATLNQSVGRFVATVSVQEGRYSSQVLESHMRSAEGRLSAVVASSITLTSSASYQRLTSTEAEYRTRKAEESVRWQLNPLVRLTGSASYWEWDVNDRGERRMAWGGILDVGRRLRTLRLRYDYGNWRREIGFSEHRVSVALRQRF